MAKNEWRRKIAPGVPVILDGVSHMVDDISGGWVTLREQSGGTRRMPQLQVAKLLTEGVAPPPLSERALDVEHRLTPAQREKFEERRGIVRWFETGLRPDQSADATPDPCHDPALVPDSRVRVRATAPLVAQRRRITLAAAIKYIDRILAKATTGESGLVDSRLVAPAKVRKHDEIEGSVREFLEARTYQSKIKGQSQYVAYAAWHRREHGTEEPPQRTFERALKNVYNRFPHLDRNTKSLASTAQAPKVANQRRSAMRPGEYWFIDTTTSNVSLRDPYAPPDKGRDYRLEFTRVMDGATRYLVGRSISEDANGYAAGLALADAFRGMLEERDAVVFDGRTYPRPFVGLPHVLSRLPIPPRRLITDNGREFLNKHCVWTLHRLGIDVEPLRVKDGRGKAQLERFFGANKTNFEEQQLNFLGGSVGDRGRDATASVILTWEELYARDTVWTEMYNVTEHRGLRAQTGRRISPTERWIELAEEFGVTEVVAWHNERIRFLPNQVLRLHPHGVDRRGLVYNAPIIRMLISADGAAPSGRVRIFWDPSDLRQVYCFDPEGNAYEVPWVYRTEDVRPFTDFTLDWALGQLVGATRSKQDHQKAMIGYVVQWQNTDAILLAQVENRRNAVEILASQLDAIRAVDGGAVIAAGDVVGPEMIDAMQAADASLALDETGIEPLPDVDDERIEVLHASGEDDLYDVYD